MATPRKVGPGDGQRPAPATTQPPRVDTGKKRPQETGSGSPAGPAKPLPTKYGHDLNESNWQRTKRFCQKPSKFNSGFLKRKGREYLSRFLSRLLKPLKGSRDMINTGPTNESDTELSSEATGFVVKMSRDLASIRRMVKRLESDESISPEELDNIHREVAGILDRFNEAKSFNQCWESYQNPNSTPKPNAKPPKAKSTPPKTVAKPTKAEATTPETVAKPARGATKTTNETEVVRPGEMKPLVCAGAAAKRIRTGCGGLGKTLDQYPPRRSGGSIRVVIPPRDGVNPGNAANIVRRCLGEGRAVFEKCLTKQAGEIFRDQIKCAVRFSPWVLTFTPSPKPKPMPKPPTKKRK